MLAPGFHQQVVLAYPHHPHGCIVFTSAAVLSKKQALAQTKRVHACPIRARVVRICWDHLRGQLDRCISSYLRTLAGAPGFLSNALRRELASLRNDLGQRQATLPPSFCCLASPVCVYGALKCADSCAPFTHNRLPTPDQISKAHIPLDDTAPKPPSSAITMLRTASLHLSSGRNPPLLFPAQPILFTVVASTAAGLLEPTHAFPDSRNRASMAHHTHTSLTDDSQYTYIPTMASPSADSEVDGENFSARVEHALAPSSERPPQQDAETALAGLGGGFDSRKNSYPSQIEFNDTGNADSAESYFSPQGGNGRALVPPYSPNDFLPLTDSPTTPTPTDLSLTPQEYKELRRKYPETRRKQHRGSLGRRTTTSEDTPTESSATTFDRDHENVEHEARRQDANTSTNYTPSDRSEDTDDGGHGGTGPAPPFPYSAYDPYDSVPVRDVIEEVENIEGSGYGEYNAGD